MQSAGSSFYEGGSRRVAVVIIRPDGAGRIRNSQEDKQAGRTGLKRHQFKNCGQNVTKLKEF
jgi:hypothetical protein